MADASGIFAVDLACGSHDASVRARWSIARGPEGKAARGSSSATWDWNVVPITLHAELVIPLLLRFLSCHPPLAAHVAACCTQAHEQVEAMLRVMD